MAKITGKITPLCKDNKAFLKSEGFENTLADACPTKSDSYPIEMLIGNNYYFDLLLPQKVDLRPGLWLFPSKLGWILGGCCYGEN